MSVLGDALIRFGVRFGGQAPRLPGESTRGGVERGSRATPEKQNEYLYRLMWVDATLRQTILDIRKFDRDDPRVKRIHGRTARAAVKGGLRLTAPSSDKALHGAWREFERRLHLNRQQKLESDMRGLMMEGSLPLQAVLDPDRRQIAALVRMPTETLQAQVSAAGTFKDPAVAYIQHDIATGAELARFALWQLPLGRLTPDNEDDQGVMGRPYLDAARAPWRKLNMTEADLVVRRRTRAPMRMSHVLEGATPEELEQYKTEIERDQQDGNWKDFFLNKKGAVTAVQGDTNLDQIADVAHLLDTFFAGAPAPKGLFGYADNLNRDILDDLKKDYFDELDAMQGVAADVYRQAFELDLLLAGINPLDREFAVGFAERRIDTPNQRADLALKYQAIGVPNEMLWQTAGLDAAAVKQAREDAAREHDPYPEPELIGAQRGAPRVSITPGNARQGESGTSITTR